MSIAPLACQLHALTQDERQRHAELTRVLVASVTQRRELSDGYAFQVSPTMGAVAGLKEWMEYEQRCCPFFRFQVEGDGDSVWVTLSGPDGVKAFIESAFPISFPAGNAQDPMTG